MAPVLIWLAVVTRAHGLNEVEEDRLIDRTHQMLRIHEAAHLDNTILGKKEISLKMNYKSGGYQPPKAKQSLYSQGYSGAKAKQAPLVKTYKPPVVAQGYKLDNLPYSSPRARDRASRAVAAASKKGAEAK